VHWAVIAMVLILEAKAADEGMHVERKAVADRCLAQCPSEAEAESIAPATQAQSAQYSSAPQLTEPQSVPAQCILVHLINQQSLSSIFPKQGEQQLNVWL
jgi:hypothetical protein